MLKRKDTWKPEEDELLATVILEHIQSGQSQLTAFEMIGEKLDRTPGACGFRWNSTVRKQYSERILEAKKSKQHLKMRSTKKSVPKPHDHPNVQLPRAIVEQLLETVNVLMEQIEKQKGLLMERNNEINSLRIKLENEKPQQLQSEDYQSLIEILNRARQLGVYERHGKIG
ncbi:RsfA family transcriptional regulator [Paenibacillus sp. GYB004]|uniref:RsfA family transcriptional regulator n=1 Tax=Paenibacillus sp. GYB004 TaxID=2994393 RepID=UPI002F9639EA